MDNYIGNKKIILVVEKEDKKTPMGEMFVEVSFEDGSKELMPKKRLDILTTQEISDDSAVRDVLRKNVGSMIFGLLHEYGIKINEVDPCIDTVIELVNNASSKSYEILLGFEKTNIPLNAINDILMSNNKIIEEDDGNKTS